MYQEETIYIAGPECFYRRGYSLWNSMKQLAQFYGFQVSMPSDNELFLEHEDLRKNADVIFGNCVHCMDQATALIADLETYRGAEPDGGTIFEMGMACAKGAKIYAFTRDLRTVSCKYQGARFEGGRLYDAEGRRLAGLGLPFSVNVSCAAKIAQGSFENCLGLFMTDLREAVKKEILAEEGEGLTERTLENGQAHMERNVREKPVLYLAGPDRYGVGVREENERRRKLCESFGFEVLTPDPELYEAAESAGISEPGGAGVYRAACRAWLQNLANVRACDLILADLNDYHGWEPESDTAFECGFGFGLSKKLFGYSGDTRIMTERIPNFGKEKEYRDINGCNAENFNYPLNLMFSSSMPIVEGNFETAAAAAAEWWFGGKV